MNMYDKIDKEQEFKEMVTGCIGRARYYKPDKRCPTACKQREIIVEAVRSYKIGKREEREDYVKTYCAHYDSCAIMKQVKKIRKAENKIYALKDLYRE